MWSSKRHNTPTIGRRKVLQLCGALTLTFGLASCTVEPLNSARTTAPLAGSVGSDSVSAILASMEVTPVSTRVAQQVRNSLLFALNGGQQKGAPQYRVELFVTSTSSTLSVQTSGLSPVSAQARIDARFNLVDLKTGDRVKGDIRRATAGYDLTSQSFANERALRDAENRAAQQVGKEIRVAIAQIIAER